MKTYTSKKYQEAIEHADAYIAEMKTWDDKRLQKHLDLFRQQIQMAYQQKNFSAHQLLYEYETQVIRARAGKCR